MARNIPKTNPDITLLRLLAKIRISAAIYDLRWYPRHSPYWKLRSAARTTCPGKIVSVHVFQHSNANEEVDLSFPSGQMQTTIIHVKVAVANSRGSQTPQPHSCCLLLIYITHNIFCTVLFQQLSTMYF